MTTELGVPADGVCERIVGFNALHDWHPAVAQSRTEGEGQGSVRRPRLAGGGTIVERLERVDDDESLYSDSLIDGPLRVSDYDATIRVGDKAATTVEGSREFRPSEASESEASNVIEGIDDAGLERLKKIFGG